MTNEGLPNRGGGDPPVQVYEKTKLVLASAELEFQTSSDTVCNIAEKFDELYLSEKDYPNSKRGSKVSQPLNRKMGKLRTQKVSKKKQKMIRRMRRFNRNIRVPDAEPPVLSRKRSRPEVKSSDFPDLDDDILRPEMSMVSDAVRRVAVRQAKSYLSSHKIEMVKEIALVVNAIDLITKATSAKAVCQQIFGYFGPKISDQQIRFILDLCSEIFRTSIKFTEQGEIIDEGASDDKEKPESPSEFINFLRKLKTHWMDMKTHPLYVNFMKLLTVLSYTGVVGMTKGLWNEGLLKSMMPESSKVKNSAGSMFEATLDVIEYCAGAIGVYESTGDVTLAVSDPDNLGFDAQIIELTEHYKLFKNGNLERQGIDDVVFYERVIAACDKVRKLVETTGNPVLLGIRNRQMGVLMAMKYAIEQSLNSKTTRMEPWSMFLDGIPGQGKSTLMRKMLEVLHLTFFQEFDEKKVYKRNQDDGFWSGYKSDMTAVVFDDFGASTDVNKNMQECDENIRTINTFSFSPNMASLEEKGNTTVRPHFVLASGNGVLNGAQSALREPAALQRRYPYVARVVAKREFCTEDRKGVFRLDSRKVEAERVRNPAFAEDEFDEVVEIHLFHTIMVGNAIKTVPFKLEGHEIALSVREFLQWCCWNAQEKLAAQKRRIEHDERERKLMVMCPCGCGSLEAFCTAAENEYVETPLTETKLTEQDSKEVDGIVPPPVQSSARLGKVPSSGVNQYSNSKKKKNWEWAKREKMPRMRPYKMSAAEMEEADLEELNAQAEREANSQNNDSEYVPEADLFQTLKTTMEWNKPTRNMSLKGIMEKFEEFSSFTSWIPDVDVKREWLPDSLWARLCPRSPDKINRSFVQNMTLVMSLTTCFFGGFAPLAFGSWFCTLGWASFSGMGCVGVTNMTRNMHQSALSGQEICQVASKWREFKIEKIVGLALVVIVACRTIKGIRSMQDPLQGDFVAQLSDSTEVCSDGPPEKIETQDGSQKNAWSGTQKIVDTSALSDVSKTTTSNDLIPFVAERVYRGQLLRDGTPIGNLCGTLVATNIMVVANHYVRVMKKMVQKRPGELVKFTSTMRRGPFKPGSSFNMLVDPFRCYSVPDTDLALVYVENSGGRKSLLKHLPVSQEVPIGPSISIQRLKTLEANKSQAVLLKLDDKIKVGDMDPYKGFYYKMEDEHYDGMCGSPIITKGARSAVIGFHTAGSVKNAHVGVGCVLTQEDVTLASEFFNKTLVMAEPLAAEGDLDERSLTPMTCVEPHYKSPLRFVTSDAQFTVLGTGSLRTSFHSRVVDNPMRRFVEEEFQVNGDDYRPPKSSPWWFGMQKTADAFAVTGTTIHPKTLDWAFKDYVKPLLVRLKRNLHEVRPLTDFEVINGTGKMFEEPINRQTSFGAPFTGKKSKRMEQCSIEEIPEGWKGPTWKFNDTVMSHVEKVWNNYSKGQRTHSVYKACLKDEVHYQKDKARVFDISPFSMTWFGRKLNLKINSFLQKNTVLSECAVGINSHGPEAQVLSDRMLKFGPDRVMAGDFSKYDCDLPMSIIRAAFRVYKVIAQAAGFDEEHLLAMDALGKDLSNPTIEYFGDYLMMNSGAHVSGNPMTAVLNSIANSLLMRVVYKEECEDENPPPFRSMVSLVTYGDDNVSAVHEKCTWYSMKTAQRRLNKYNMIYTDPQKNDIVADFLPWQDVEFLKRSFHRKHEVGCVLGALGESSIMKPLLKMVWDPSKAISREAVAVDIMTSCLREAFNHGEVFYEDFRTKLTLAARKAKLELACDELLISFSMAEDRWRQDYAKQRKHLEV
uniref:Putative non-structural protein n=1 Tax=Picornavirales N_OV_039 TaxID=2016020 RepID=A0A218NJR5_9VIRU|nr:putative non-structural protein [Picornavirales N_OV_039]